MNTTRRHCEAHTLLELLLVIAILGVLMMLTLPVMHKAQVRAKRTACMNQLHQVGIAAHDFAHDHGDQFPHQVSTNAGGTREFAYAGFAMSGEFYFAYRHFQALSNSLDTPKILRCPADHGRQKADTFGELANQYISYFAGLGADYTHPYSWLSGDGGIDAESLASGSILRLSTNVAPSWNRDCHDERGNLLFADGHVEGMSSVRLSGAAQATGQPVAYLLPPFVPRATTEAQAENTAVNALEQYIQMQSGGASPTVAGTTTPTPPSSKPATDAPKTKPVSDPLFPATPAPPKAALAKNATTNNLAAVAHAQPRPSGVDSTGRAGGKSTISSDTADSAPATVLNFVIRPELNLSWWLLVLILAMLAAFALGWHVHKERSRRRSRVAVGHPRAA